jgi:predicted ATPase
VHSPEVLGDGRSDSSRQQTLSAACRGLRYNSKVFMAPPWKQIYCTNAERNGDFDHALEAYHATVDAYLKCGYALIELPRLPPEIRASFVTEQISDPADPESK